MTYTTKVLTVGPNTNVMTSQIDVWARTGWYVVAMSPRVDDEGYVVIMHKAND